MLNGLADSFPPIVITVGCKAILFISWARCKSHDLLVSCKVGILLANHTIFKKGVLGTEKPHKSRWDMSEETKLCDTYDLWSGKESV